MRLSDWPSLRLVVPLAGGILISDTIQDTGTLVRLSCALLIPASAVTLISLLSGRRLSGLYGAGLVSCFFILGCLVYGRYSLTVHVRWPDGDGVHLGRLVDWPQEKARSYRLDLELADSAGDGSRIILYVPKDSAARSVQPGMTVGFYGRIQAPANSGAVDFDYAAYLYRHGISGTLWVPADHWSVIGRPEKTDLRTRAMLLRGKMVGKLEEWGLSGRSLAVTAAVSLGEKRALDDSVRQLYSHSGVSHVLAVSGLHVGIVYWLLGVLLPGVLFPYRMRWLRDAVIISVLWAYAFAIGMPLSITRSLTMFSMLAVCRASGRDSSPVNALAFAALAILLVQPEGLFDVGFQLSFCAVLSILLFEPGIRRLVTPVTAVGGYFWGIVSVSLAAQLGTAPLSAFHFGTFPTWFLLSNIMVIPLMFATVCLSMLIWAFGWFPLTREVTVWLLDGIIGLENGILERISALPYAVVQLDTCQEQAVWTAYSLMLSVWLWIHEKNARSLVRGLCVTASISLFGMVRYFAV